MVFRRVYRVNDLLFRRRKEINRMTKVTRKLNRPSTQPSNTYKPL
nr:MAG TPA: hypothetical protein [Caudoviricetes sp.]